MATPSDLHPHQLVSVNAYWTDSIPQLGLANEEANTHDHVYADALGEKTRDMIRFLITQFAGDDANSVRYTVPDGESLPLAKLSTESVLKVVEDHKRALISGDAGAYYREVFTRMTQAGRFSETLFDELGVQMLSDPLYLGGIASFYDPDSECMLSREVKYLQPSDSGLQFVSIRAQNINGELSEDGIQVQTVRRVGQVYVSPPTEEYQVFEKVIAATLITPFTPR